MENIVIDIATLTSLPIELEGNEIDRIEYARQGFMALVIIPIFIAIFSFLI